MFHRSERLLLRPGWLEDATELTARIADHAIVRNLATVPWPYRIEHARGWLAAPRDPLLPTFLLTLPDASGSRIIGSCGLHQGEQGPELGYWLARDQWGKGYATEAVRAVLMLARTLGHERIMARHAADNLRSGRVLRKSGFRPTGRVLGCFSQGRNAEVEACEYQIELGGVSGVAEPAMPRAA